MSVDAALAPPRVFGRPGARRLVAGIAGQGIRSFLRSPIAVFFTIGFPVGLLAIIATMYGSAAIDDLGGIPVVQYFAPALAVFGAAEAVFCVLATQTAQLREQGVLKRLRGSPAPPVAIIAGRIVAAVAVAVSAVTIALLLGVSVYHLHVIWRTLPAVVVILVVGIGCFAALGLAVVALVRRSTAVTAITNALLILVSYISGVFLLSTGQPAWAQRLGSALPLKPFVTALSQAFNPTRAGAGFTLDLLPLLGWGVAGTLVAWRFFRWEPVAGGRGSTPAAAPAEHLAKTVPMVGHPAVSSPGRPGVLGILGNRSAHALTSLLREPGSVFFAVVMPALLLALLPVLVARDAVDRIGTVHGLLPAMAAYGVAVATYVTMPSSVARAREAGVLKRLRGTPVPPWAHLAGWAAAALVLAAVAVGLLVLTAGFGYQVWADPAHLGALLVDVVLVSACFALLGFVLIRLARTPQALTATTLGTLLPLSFISDVFVVGVRMPAPLGFIGDALPLKHAVHAFDQALRSATATGGFAWRDLAVVLAWTAAAAILARRMSWEPRGQR